MCRNMHSYTHVHRLAQPYFKNSSKVPNKRHSCAAPQKLYYNYFFPHPKYTTIVVLGSQGPHLGLPGVSWT